MNSKNIRTTYVMVIFIIVVLLLTVKKSFGQLYLKGSYFVFPVEPAGYYFDTYSIATEYKKDRLGIEFLFNHKRYEYIKILYKDSLKLNKLQIALKYYVKNKDGKFKLYASPIFNHRDFIRYYYSYVNPTMPFSVRTKGFGYGLSIGLTKDFGKYLGFEIAPFYNHFRFYYGAKHMRDGSTINYIPDKKHVFGLKIFLYFKINLINHSS